MLTGLSIVAAVSVPPFLGPLGLGAAVAAATAGVAAATTGVAAAAAGVAAAAAGVAAAAAVGAAAPPAAVGAADGAAGVQAARSAGIAPAVTVRPPNRLTPCTNSRREMRPVLNLPTRSAICSSW